MKLALLSNLHANLRAWKACHAHATDQGADRMAVLGDLVGYGAEPATVVDEVMAPGAAGAIVVGGNHDAMAVSPPAHPARTHGISMPDTQWSDALARCLPAQQIHVLESGDVADALLRYANANHVTVIVMGAATHELQMQRLIATVPIRVAMSARCTVILVKTALPFGLLQAAH